MEIDDFCCPICENLYDEEKHIPRLIKICGHTYCELCINNIMQQNNNNFHCNEDIKIYEKIENISDVPKNLTLLNLIKKAKSRSNLNNSNNLTIKNRSFLQASSDQANKNDLKELTPINYSSINFSFTSVPNNSVKNNIKNYPIDKLLNNTPALFNTENNFKEANSFASNDILQYKTQPSVNEFHLESIHNLENDNSNNNKYFSENFSSNNPYFMNNDEYYCLQHGRKREIVCLDDRVKICTSCALFGDHKNHNLKSEEDLFKELYIKSEILIEYFEMMESFENKIKEYKNQETLSKIENIKLEAEEKEKILKEDVSSFFKEMRFFLKEREKQILFQISANFKENFNKKIFYFTNTLDFVNENINKWKLW